MHKDQFKNVNHNSENRTAEKKNPTVYMSTITKSQTLDGCGYIVYSWSLTSNNAKQERHGMYGEYISAYIYIF